MKNQVFEGDGVVVADYPLMSARQHQFQLDARQLDERALGLSGLDREAAIEVGDEVLFEIAIAGGVIGNAVVSERQSPLDLPKARSLRPRACGERARIC